MSSRTVLLLALLVIVAGGGWLFHQRQQTAVPIAGLPAAAVASRVDTPQQPRHARIADDAAILAPFVPRLCWHGIDSDVRQCRTQWVDTTPKVPSSKTQQ